MGFFKKLWNFLWHEDSLLSWTVSIILAFLIVKFILIGGILGGGGIIGYTLGTDYPIVAVVSESMEHRADCVTSGCDRYTICGEGVDEKGYYSVDMYWDTCGGWYEENNITLEEFEDFSLKNGFNKGDIMVLIGKEAKDINTGDVVVFDGNLNYPIIHRVVDIWQEDGKYYFKTKGDNNHAPSVNEERLTEDKLLGKAVLRLPLLGWIKIGFSSLLNVLIGGLK